MMKYPDVKRLDTRTQLGKRIIRALITEKNQMRLGAFLKERSRSKMIKSACQDKEAQLRSLNYTCLEHLAPITAPLVLVSPLEYSGGDVLSQFLDGHPQVLTLPNGLKIGAFLNNSLLTFDRNKSPQKLFESMGGEVLLNKSAVDNGQNNMHHVGGPFVFLPQLQRLMFIKTINAKERVTPRDVCDAYLTSFFGAWLNCRSIGSSKKIVATVAPGIEASVMKIESFFKTYPDGKLIFLIKNPEIWYTQALRSEPNLYRDINASLELWKGFANTAMEAQGKFKDRVCLIDFSDLVTKTEAVMRYLADFLGIDYQGILLEPTFNRIPVTSCHETRLENQFSDGEASASFNIYADQLQVITEMTTEVYQKVLHQVAVF